MKCSLVVIQILIDNRFTELRFIDEQQPFVEDNQLGTIGHVVHRQFAVRRLMAGFASQQLQSQDKFLQLLQGTWVG